MGLALRRGSTETDAQREHRVMMKAEVGVMPLQAKNCQELPAITRSWKEAREESA